MMVRRIRQRGIYYPNKWVTIAGLVTIGLVTNMDVASMAAKSPASIVEGRVLFEKNWTPTRSQQGDGLGPLFNGQSCVACHHQGGVGGGGDARFNAKTIGFDWLKITGPASQFSETQRISKASQVAGLRSGARLPTAMMPEFINAGPGARTDNVPDRVAQAIGRFHPGFVSPAGGIVSTFTIAHHGGTPQFADARRALMDRIPAEFSPHGGPVSGADVRMANATPIQYSSQLGDGEVMIRARLYQRNTPSLFGAGLIDQIMPDHVIPIARQQKRHPEISGRLAGRFGWRGNVATLEDFCEQACANELGLSTARKMQPADPTNPHYQNLQTDISDAMIHSMAAFVAALPAPEREIPGDEEQRLQAIRGEQVFANVGCAICHVPDVGPAKGVYSDLLLHDMGVESADLNPATPVSHIDGLNPFLSSRFNSGRPKVAMVSGSQSRSTSRRRSRSSAGVVATVRITSSYYGGGISLSSMTMIAPGEYVFPRQPTPKQSPEPTYINQEWRTPPLWGVRDSAPYLHDGRAETLLEAIIMHEGEAKGTRDRFLNLSLADRNAILTFLNTLVAPKNASVARN